jgi:hypothetical protein
MDSSWLAMNRLVWYKSLILQRFTFCKGVRRADVFILVHSDLLWFCRTHLTQIEGKDLVDITPLVLVKLYFEPGQS